MRLGDWAIDPIILNLGINCVVSLTHRPLYSGKRTTVVQCVWGLVGPWASVEEEGALLCWDSSLDYQACSLFTISNAICRVQRIFIALLVTPWHIHADTVGRRRYGSSQIASSLGGGWWAVSTAPWPLYSGEGSGTLLERLGWHHERAWAQINSSPPKFKPGTVHLVESRYADWHMSVACLKQDTLISQ